MTAEWQWDESLFAGAAPHYPLGRLPYPDGLADSIAAALDLDGTGTLLDVGCGPGTVTLRLAPFFARAIGVDPDRGMLAEADVQATEAGLDPRPTWILARAEDLAAHLEPGTIRAATFGASFHWMDRDLVAAEVHDLLEPGGAFVHLGPGHPTERPPTEVPDDAIAELIEGYLGTTRRAGQGIRLTSPGDEEAVLARLPYDGPERVVVRGQPVERTPDQVVHLVLSMSNAAPHLFGDRLDDFVADLRGLLGDRTYVADQGDTLVRIWRKRTGKTSPMTADDRTSDEATPPV